MVGIPGKSKGCHTCRRRKIRCTLEKPDCAKCLQSGRQCEGYERGAVFLNRTPQGWEKRTRLDEARPRQRASAADVPTQTPAQTISNSTSRVQVKGFVQETGYVQENGYIEEYSPPPKQENASSTLPTKANISQKRSNPHNVVVPQKSHKTLLVRTPDMRKKLFQGLFLESYLPMQNGLRGALQGAWLIEALRLENPGQALEFSLHALCITRVGRVTLNEDLVKRGNAAYGMALRALRNALESSKLAGRDETLASCMILAIYELYESTSNSTSAHEEHMIGIERLVQYRGSQQTGTPLGKFLIKNISYATMIKSIQFRKKSRLLDLIDQIEWWDAQGILFAKGHVLGGLLQDLDIYKKCGQHSIPASAGYLQRCVALDASFEAWHEELLEDSPCPIHWTPHHQDARNQTTDLEFANLELAHLMIDYWALRLALTTTIDIICHQVPSELPPAIKGMIEHLRAAHGKERQMEFATNIMSALPYCMKPEYGVSSSQKCLFSGRVALFALRRWLGNGDERLGHYEEVYLDLTAKKGLKFAKDMTKQEPTSWSPYVQEGSPEVSPAGSPEAPLPE